MLENPGILFSILMFIAAIGPLVFVHELGHYLVGRWCGVQADVFSIGFGREVIGWTDRRGTRWKVGALPLGGYVQFAGDMNPASVPDRNAERVPGTFQAARLWQRSLIVLAGPLTNFLFAMVLLCGFFAYYGERVTPAIIAQVDKGSVAERAGFNPGDEIVAVGDTEIVRYVDLQRIVMDRPGQVLSFTVRNDGITRQIIAAPENKEISDEFGNTAHVGRLGIVGVDPVFAPVPFYRLPGAALNVTVQSVESMFTLIKQLFVGQRSIKELGGPVKIAKVSGEQASLGLAAFLSLMIMLSINLGFINLLPIPMMDGGHLLFYAIEAVRQKPASPQVLEWTFRGGLMVLMALFLVITFNDLGSIGLWDRISGIMG